MTGVWGGSEREKKIKWPRKKILNFFSLLYSPRRRPLVFWNFLKNTIVPCKYIPEEVSLAMGHEKSESWQVTQKKSLYQSKAWFFRWLCGPERQTVGIVSIMCEICTLWKEFSRKILRMVEQENRLTMNFLSPRGAGRNVFRTRCDYYWSGFWNCFLIISHLKIFSQIIWRYIDAATVILW